MLFVSNPAGVDDHARRESIDSDQRSESRAARGRWRSGNRHADRPVRDGLPDAEQRPRADRHLERAARACTSSMAPSRGRSSFANNCLLARRLVERGVRFVQLYHRGWDTHGASVGTDIAQRVPELCLETDRAATALVRDLKQRGLLDTTLVIWGGEFGRTPMNEARGGSRLMGRDHHPRAFTIWMAGGGVKPGHHRRQDRRSRLQRRRGPGRRPRPARHDPAPDGHRAHEADLQVPGTRVQADRRAREGRDEAVGVTGGERGAE